MNLAPALLDANVLVPPVLRDTLLSTAEAGLYQARWSTAILDEVVRVLLRYDRFGMTQARADRLVAQMERTFPDASVSGYEHLTGAMRNHPNDRHILAAAVVADARVIVTLNLRHFPPAALDGLQVEARHPDVFLLSLFERDASTMVRVIEDQAAALRHPPRSVEDVLARLTRFVPRFADRIQAARQSRA